MSYDDGDDELTLSERIADIVPWRVRAAWYLVRGFVWYWAAVAWWTWATRRVEKTEITLHHRDDAEWFRPGQVLGASDGSGASPDLSRLVRIDHRRGVLICARERP